LLVNSTVLLKLFSGILLAVVISAAAYRARALSRSGALAATLLGTVIFGLGGLEWAVLLLGFFISSSVLSALFSRRKAGLNEKFSKGSRRDAGQVLANGGIAGLLVLFHLALPSSVWAWLVFAGSLAAVNADTWATELGVLSQSQPRLISNGRPVERGTSGGVTLLGSLWALTGAALIAVLAVIFWQGGISSGGWQAVAVQIGLISLAGLCGSMVDSFLGATVQAIYTCPTCNKETERHPLHSCGTPTTLKRGLAWLNNDWVNTACSFTGAVVILIFGLIFPGPLGLSNVDLTGPGGVSMTSFPLSSSAFKAGAEIPRKFTCDADNLSPALSWSELPQGTKSLALVTEDPDAPSGVFIHWVLYNIPASRTDLAEGIAKTVQVSGTGTQGINDFREVGYDGPCPPSDKAHRYYFKLYALDADLHLPEGLNAVQLKRQIQGHVLAQAEWMGTYKR
jgi:Raf kinase inhibitor-like YbhB/YbcL family protein/uncharacterized protein (TIGR00297 family)